MKLSRKIKRMMKKGIDVIQCASDKNAQKWSECKQVAAKAAVTTCLLAAGLTGAEIVEATPVNGDIVGGEGKIEQVSTAQMSITQASGRMVIDWGAFSIGAGETVNVIQPGSESALLNRVTGNSVSMIGGSLNANGQVYVVNPNGINVGSTASINAAGVFMSTGVVTPEAFMEGKYAPSGGAGQIENNGVINASAVDLRGAAAIYNNGSIIAHTAKGDGGKVAIVGADYVKNAGNIDASATVAAGNGGEIIVTADMKKGVLDVGSGKQWAIGGVNGGKGGFVETSAANVEYRGTDVRTADAAGQAGTWLLGSGDIVIDAAGAVTISKNLYCGDISIKAVQGSVYHKSGANITYDNVQPGKYRNLTYIADNNVHMEDGASIIANAGSALNVRFIANAAAVNDFSSGAIAIEGGASIKTFGGSLILGGADLANGLPGYAAGTGTAGFTDGVRIGTEGSSKSAVLDTSGGDGTNAYIIIKGRATAYAEVDSSGVKIIGSDITAGNAKYTHYINGRSHDYGLYIHGVDKIATNAMDHSRNGVEIVSAATRNTNIVTADATPLEIYGSQEYASNDYNSAVRIHSRNAAMGGKVNIYNSGSGDITISARTNSEDKGNGLLIDNDYQGYKVLIGKATATGNINLNVNNITVSHMASIKTKGKLTIAPKLIDENYVPVLRTANIVIGKGERQTNGKFNIVLNNEFFNKYRVFGIDSIGEYQLGDTEQTSGILINNDLNLMNRKLALATGGSSFGIMNGNGGLITAGALDFYVNSGGINSIGASGNYIRIASADNSSPMNISMYVGNSKSLGSGDVYVQYCAGVGLNIVNSPFVATGNRGVRAQNLNLDFTSNSSNQVLTQAGDAAIELSNSAGVNHGKLIISGNRISKSVLLENPQNQIHGLNLNYTYGSASISASPGDDLTRNFVLSGISGDISKLKISAPGMNIRQNAGINLTYRGCVFDITAENIMLNEKDYLTGAPLTNKFYGAALKATNADVEVSISNTSTFTLGDSDVSKDLLLKTGASVGQEAGTMVKTGGTAQFLLGGTGKLTLANKGNNFNIIALDASDTQLVDADDLTIAAVTDERSANKGKSKVDGLNLSAGKSISINTALDMQSAAGAGTTGEFRISAGADINIAKEAGVAATTLNSEADSDLILQAGQNIQNDGYIRTDRKATINAAETFESYGQSSYKTVSFSGKNVWLNYDGNIDISSADVSKILNIAATGSITQNTVYKDGAIKAASAFLKAPSGVTLTNAANQIRLLGLTTGNAVLVNNCGLTFEKIQVSGDLDIHNIGALKSIDIVSNFNVGGLAKLTAGDGVTAYDIILDNNGKNFAGKLELSGRNISFKNDTQALAMNIQKINATGDLTISSIGDLSQTGAVVAGGTARFDSVGGNVVLNNAENDFNIIRVNAANATVVDKNGLTLGESAISGNFDVTTQGDINQNGAATVSEATTINSNGNNIVLDNVGNDFNSINLGTAKNAKVADANDIVIAGANINNPASAGNALLDVSAGGNITQTGGITVIGDSQFTVADNNKIVLTSQDNRFVLGAVSLTAKGTGAARLFSSGNGESMYVKKMDVGSGGLLLHSLNGDISQSGIEGSTVTVDGALMLITNKCVTLDEGDNSFKSLVLNAARANLTTDSDVEITSATARSFSLQATGDIKLGKITIGKTGLWLDSRKGTITQDAAHQKDTEYALQVEGSSEFVTHATDKYIRMFNYHNVFGGEVTITSPNNNGTTVDSATILNADQSKELILGDCITGGYFSILAGSIVSAEDTAIHINRGGRLNLYSGVAGGKIDIDVYNNSGLSDTYIVAASYGGLAGDHFVRIDDKSVKNNKGVSIPITLGGFNGGKLDVQTNCALTFNLSKSLNSLNVSDVDGISSTMQEVKIDKVLDVTGDIKINAGSLQVNKTVTGNLIDITATGTGNSVTIGSGASIAALATGLNAGSYPAIMINAVNGNFVNNAGAGALVVQPKSSGTYAPFWLVYTADKANSQAAFNGMAVRDAIGNPGDNPVSDDILEDGQNYWLHKADEVQA